MPNQFHHACARVRVWAIPQCTNFFKELLCTFKHTIKLRPEKKDTQCQIQKLQGLRSAVLLRTLINKSSDSLMNVGCISIMMALALLSYNEIMALTEDALANEILLAAHQTMGVVPMEHWVC